ncbi:MAG TPA: hypothetical protein VK674_07185 [Candidatus Limnocylindria bacterium]|nr:hypothetical protein [Candidatus Limnocylindria bacterium]
MNKIPDSERVTVALSVPRSDDGSVMESWTGYVPNRFGIDVMPLDNPPYPTSDDLRLWHEVMEGDDIHALVVAVYNANPIVRREKLNDRQQRVVDRFPELSTVGPHTPRYDSPLPWDVGNISHVREVGEKPVFTQTDPLQVKSFETAHPNPSRRVAMTPAIRELFEIKHVIYVGRDIAKIKEELLYP